MPIPSARPRILIITPGIICIPDGNGKTSNYITARTNGFADFLSGLAMSMLDQGIDIHIAQPDYRYIFQRLSQIKNGIACGNIPADRTHFAEDRAFFYSSPFSINDQWENIKISLAFQRELINRIVPRVQPDLIHCHDWMTGLIPSMARQWEIPCLFSVHTAETAVTCLSQIEDIGMDAAAFWQNAYYHHYPTNYEETRNTNPLNFLLSGIFAADFVNILYPAFLIDTVKQHHRFYDAALNHLLAQKRIEGNACETYCPPNPSYNQGIRQESWCNYNLKDGRRDNQSHRAMKQGTAAFNHASMAQHYMALYEKMLRCRLINPKNMKAPDINKKTEYVPYSYPASHRLNLNRTAAEAV